MLRTFQQSFGRDGVRDELRDTPLTEAELAAVEEEDLQAFEAQLPDKIGAAMQAQKKKGWEEKSAAEVEEDLRAARTRRVAVEKAKGPAQRFAGWVRTIVVENMKSSIQAMFYACDYSTKPNMTCAPLLVAIRDGVRRLEEQLQQEEEESRSAALCKMEGAPPFQEQAGATSGGKTWRPLTKEQDEARRRLIRQATAANQAIVKGNCLMAMQLLTGREVLRSHFPWQLMMKHCMWMALQHRRELQGFDEQERENDIALDLAEGAASAEEGSEDDGAGDEDCDSEQATRPPFVCWFVLIFDIVIIDFWISLIESLLPSNSAFVLESWRIFILGYSALRVLQTGAV